MQLNITFLAKCQEWYVVVAWPQTTLRDCPQTEYLTHDGSMT